MKKKKLSTASIIILGLVAVIVAMVLLRFAGFFKPRELMVETELVKPRNITEIVTATGKIQPEQEVKISPDVSGEIIELRVALGQLVKKGDLLLKIQPDIYQAAVNQSRAALNNVKAQLKASEAAYKQAQARAENARKNFERNKDLLAKKVITQVDYDASEMDFLVAEQQSAAAYEQLQSSKFSVESAEASLKENTDRLSKTIIYAPISGTVSSLSVEKGERVVGTNQMAGTEIMRIANLRVMEVLVEVSEIDITRIKENDSARIEIDAFPNRLFAGVITEIAKTAKNATLQTGSEQSSSFEVKARILADSYRDLIDDSTQTPFMPGMSAMVDIVTATHKNVLAVPILAVTTRDIKDADSKNKRNEKQEEIVFVYKDGMASEQTVKTGIQNDFYIEVTEGLSEGAEIIKGPYDAITVYLTEGKKVERKTKSQ
ncbi:efflux RND transporter periplasmic adaptor subunit [bacterium]|nr:efflux RND transporter periplasmic adaptor subunit [bacterium]